MNEDNKNSYPRPSFGAVFASISIWVAIVLLVVVFLHHCSRPQFFKLSLVSMADRDLTKEVAEHKGVVNWSQLQVDSMKVVHLAANIDSLAFVALRDSVLCEEIKAGRLMTAEQMSEKITGYYDKLIDVLIALFVIFSVASYFVINNKFKKQYEDDKAVFVEEIKRSLLDSQSLHDDLVNGISTKIENSLVTDDDLQGIRNDLQKDNENFELLANLYDELTEKAAAREEIDDDVDNNQNA